MKSKTFYYSLILVFLFATTLVGCSSTDINEEVGIEDNKDIEKNNEENPRVQIKAIDASKVKVPAGG
jgi:hypothetical protein